MLGYKLLSFTSTAPLRRRLGDVGEKGLAGPKPAIRAGLAAGSHPDLGYLPQDRPGLPIAGQTRAGPTTTTGTVPTTSYSLTAAPAPLKILVPFSIASSLKLFHPACQTWGNEIKMPNSAVCKHTLSHRTLPEHDSLSKEARDEEMKFAHLPPSPHTALCRTVISLAIFKCFVFKSQPEQHNLGVQSH